MAKINVHCCFISENIQDLTSISHSNSKFMYNKLMKIKIWDNLNKKLKIEVHKKRKIILSKNIFIYKKRKIYEIVEFHLFFLQRRSKFCIWDIFVDHFLTEKLVTF